MPAETAAAAIGVVRLNTIEVQGRGNFELFDVLFDPEVVYHTPQPGFSPDRDGARALYHTLRTAFPDFHAEIHFLFSDGDRVTTYKTYHGTHTGDLLCASRTGRSVQFDTVDVMRIRKGRVVEHWGVADLLGLARQLGTDRLFDDGSTEHRSAL